MPQVPPAKVLPTGGQPLARLPWPALWPTLLTLAALFGGAQGPASAQEQDPPTLAATVPHLAGPRLLEVWARVTFGTDGRLERLELADEEGVTEGVMAEVRQRLAAARIQPPLDDGQPARFTTGVRLRYRAVTDDAHARLRLLDLAISPLPLGRSVPPLPTEIRRSRGWTGSVKGTCSVDVEGQCAEVAVEALPGIPESLRRWVRVSMAPWRFEPQRLNDRAVPGEFSHTFDIRIGDRAPEDFRTPKFDRIERQRF